MTFLKKLREAARTCSNVDYQAKLRAAADHAEDAARWFSVELSHDSLRTLNGEWANADRILKNVPPEADPSPTTGGTDPTRFAVAA